MSRIIKRCDWALKNPTYIKYHDTEWGVPIYNDQKIFEYLLLETFQAGLSWITILTKRNNFYDAFDAFNYQKIANYSNKKMEALRQNKSIVRNNLKIQAAKKNAVSFIEVQKEFGSFSKYLWGFVNGNTIRNNFKNVAELPANTPLSDKISNDLKKRGFKFVGPTIIYSHMQAIGMVNDHIIDCFRYNQV